MKKILLGGLLGGVALFMWESVAHLLTPLGQVGVQGLNNELAVMSALKANIAEPGFYFFPAPEIKAGMTRAQQQEAMRKAEEKWRTGPSGIMVVHPNGAESLSARQLLTQFAGDVLAMMLAALLLSQMAAAWAYGKRVSFVGLMGLFPTLCVEVPYWNWYGFPGIYLLAQFSVHLIGFLVGGLVLAAFFKSAAPERIAARAAA